MESICELVRKQERNFTASSTQLSKYVSFDFYNTLQRIDAYLNSKHISGEQDSLGRDKPFFNIVTAAVNIWYRATDLDRKDIRIRATKKRDQVKAFLATVHLRDWMKRAKFGKFLNLWGRTLAQYGSAVVKFVEKEGVLFAEVIPWNRIIVDAIDFNNNPKVEKLYYTPAQLKQMKAYDKEMVDKLILGAHATRKMLDNQNKDTLDEYIELYEVHGLLPKSYLTDKDDDKDEFVQQMHVVSFIENDGKYTDYTLFKGREKKDPYMITHLIEESGRTLSIGAVESLFDPQWMVNHSMKAAKDTLDIASKLVFQTADAFYTGRNVIHALETGDILVHKPEMPLTKVNDADPDITAIQNFSSQWRLLSQELTSTPDALRGTTLPSGTPYSLGAYLGGQAGNLFEQMVENKGLDLEDMMREHIIPHIKTKMDNGDEVAATLEDYDLTEIDSIYVPFQAVKNYNDRTFDQLMTMPMGIETEGVPTPFDPTIEEQGVRQELAKQGTTRYFTPDDMRSLKWNEYFKDFEWECEVEVTNETVDKQAVLQTLGSVLQTSVQNPEMFKLIMGKILDETGTVSPIEFKAAAAAPMPMKLGTPTAMQ